MHSEPKLAVCVTTPINYRIADTFRRFFLPKLALVYYINFSSYCHIHYVIMNTQGKFGLDNKTEATGEIGKNFILAKNIM